MKAAIATRYGSPEESLRVGDAPKPGPDAGEVLIRVEAATVSAGDTEIRQMAFPWYFGLGLRAYFGFFRPRRPLILGQDLAGSVEAAGSGVTKFKPGDRVMAFTGLKLGGHAEYACLPADDDKHEYLVAPAPEGWSAAEATTLPFAAFEAIFFVDKAGVKPGDEVLIVGGGGSIGTFAIQIARARGARVTAVDRADKHAMMREIGADHVLDVGVRDYSEGGARQFDSVIGITARTPFGRSVRALRRGGVIVLANPWINLLIRGLIARITSGKRLRLGAAGHAPADLAKVEALVADGALKPVIGETFALDDIVAAHRYAESAGKTGNVVLKIG